MKEADIVFGTAYAVEDEGSVDKAVVKGKVPVQPGKSRSRMYEVRYDKNNQWHATVDASKILMPWDEYEKTPEYLDSHVEEVIGKLETVANGTITQWSSTLHARFQALDLYWFRRPIEIDTRRLDEEESVAALLKGVKDTEIQVPISFIMPLLGEEFLPGTEQIKDAVRDLRQVRAKLQRQRLPSLEQRLASDRSPGTQVHWPTVVEYAQALRDSETPGPHPKLIEVSRLWPRSPILLDLTKERQFQYLIPYLTT